MKNPNICSRNTYWKENWEPIQHQVEVFHQEIDILPGLKMLHTGGHSDGHSIIVIEEEGDAFIHMADAYTCSPKRALGHGL
jgi:glyoxylase-like metal-dependent hydrolase (beta-lactamase superfamily II)